MKKLFSLYHWIKESTLRTTAGLFVLVALAATGIGITHAATSYDVAQETRMYLAVSITNTQTTGIIIDTPQLNGATFTFSTTSGGVLRFNYGSHQEDVYYSSATLNAAKQVTLVGVIRNVCPQYFRTIVSCGSGQYFGKGTIVQLIQDARLFNLKANIDRANQFTASGGLSFTGSGSFSFPTFATTALRNQELGTTPSGNILGACVTATGLCYLSTGGTWTTIGNTGVGNATESVAGIGQLASLKAQSGAVTTGSTGASNLLYAAYTTGSGGTARAWRIPYVSRIGVLTGSLLGTGNQYANSGKTYVSGTGAWVASPSSATTFAYYTASTGSSIIASGGGTGDQNFSLSKSIASGDMTTGATFLINLTETGGNSAGRGLQFKLKLGSTTVVSFAQVNIPVGGGADIQAKLVFRVTGASGIIQPWAVIRRWTNNATLSNSEVWEPLTPISINTTSALTLQPTVAISTDDGTSAMRITTMDITRLAP